MKNRRKVVLLLGAALAALLFLSGCASLPTSQRESRVEALLEVLAAGEVDEAVELTSVPFLLDSEILTTEQDAKLLWSNLKEVSALFVAAEIISIRPAWEEDYTLFNDSAEMRVFFERALPENPSLVEIATPHGRFFLLLSGRRFGTPRFVGMKGPVS